MLWPLLFAFCLISSITPVSARVTDTAKYDYVIVGGGTAGLALASRLTENPSITVAVVEAGTYYEIADPQYAIPGADIRFAGAGTDPNDLTSPVDWGFVTTPQAGVNGRQLHYARGKCMGGSSARNFMVYHRGTCDSYQAWADAVGDQSYSWSNWLPYFKKSVTFTPPKSPPRAANASANYDVSAFNPQDGPLEVSYANFAIPFSSWMERALNAIGIRYTKDFNSGTLMGAQYCSNTICPETEQRSSSESSFLRAAADRKNLKVYTFTLAKRVLFDGNKYATGVLVNSTTIVKANKEVILSAGAFQSPQLLMVSGIGEPSLLKKYEIPVLANRPGVGQNMTDHVATGPSYRVNLITSTRVANDPAFAAALLQEYTADHTGPYTNPVSDYLGWEKVPQNLLASDSVSTLNAFPADWPEIEYISSPGYIGNFSNLEYQPNDGYQYASIVAALVAPLSRGTVSINSADAADPPLINPNYLTHPSDVAVLTAGFKRARQAFASKTMRAVLTDPVEYYPGPQVQSDAQIEAFLRANAFYFYHAAGTCRMGRRDDPNAVVDSKAKVIGVEGLRVVDASAFALLPPGHPQSTVYALAEKIAADILAGN